MAKFKEKEIKKIVEQIKEKYQPEKIILFGSFAYGKPKASSDVDLLIIKQTKQKKVNRIKEVLMNVQSDLPIEPLVYTQKELKNRIDLGDFFFKSVIKKGKILYAK